MTEKLKDEYIREAAYYIWEKEGRPESDGYEFWMKAIKQLSTSRCKCACTAKKTAVKKTAPKPVSKPATTPTGFVKKVAVKKK